MTDDFYIKITKSLRGHSILNIMLQLSNALQNRPVLSLRTGGVVATATTPIINPNNLKIEGFYCNDIRSKETLILLTQDIRDIITQGYVVNDFEVLTEPEELIRLHEIMNINYDPIRKTVVTLSKQKVGKVSDYATNIESMYIQKLYVTQSLMKQFTGGNLVIDRTQVQEITNKKIIVQDLLQPIPATSPLQA